MTKFKKWWTKHKWLPLHNKVLHAATCHYSAMMCYQKQCRYRTSKSEKKTMLVTFSYSIWKKLWTEEKWIHNRSLHAATSHFQYNIYKAKSNCHFCNPICGLGKINCHNLTALVNPYKHYFINLSFLVKRNKYISQVPKPQPTFFFFEVSCSPSQGSRPTNCR